jgi:hypothetical protein
MKNEMKEFLAEGFARYKQASHVMKEFFTNTQNELQNILTKRKDWGSVFVPKETIKTKSTKYWDAYPLVNAEKTGSIGGETVRIKIAVNWFASKSEYPFFTAYLKNGPEKIYQNIVAYYEKAQFELRSDERGFILYPKQDDFDLERDFNILIDELLRTISK